MFYQKFYQNPISSGLFLKSVIDNVSKHVKSTGTRRVGYNKQSVAK